MGGLSRALTFAARLVAVAPVRSREERGARGDIGIWPSAAVIETGEIGEMTRAAIGEPGPLAVVTAGRG